MPKQAVIGIVRYKEMTLLVRKRSDRGSLAGEWHVPGETIESGESDEKALIRGMREEAGIEIQVGNYVGSHTTPKRTKVRWYECVATTATLTPGSDIDEAIWVPDAQVPLWHTRLAYSRSPSKILERLGY